MEKNISIISRIGKVLAAALLVVLTLASCSSDDKALIPLDTPSLTEGQKTVSSLAFNWQPVAGASQYAYELYSPEGVSMVNSGVTSASSVIATGLKPNTTYTLKVWAYSPLGSDKTTSPIATITATTNPVVALDAPVPESTTGAGGVTISWPEVEHATSYLYRYVDSDGTEVKGETETNSVTLTNLAIGEYTIYITATSTDENYSDSESIALTFRRAKAESWRRSGTYTSASLGKSFEAEIVAYDDGSYAIENPYGETGYSIGFVASASGAEIVPTVNPDDYGYYLFYVSAQYYVAIYTSGGYSQYDGDENGGSIWFYSYLYDNDGNAVGNGGYDEFNWEGAAADEIPADCKAEVPAMLSTTWAQYAPFYNATPSIDGKQCLTGCVATALAQILNYYQYPSQLSDGTQIDWANMLPDYSGDYTQAQADAVALLMSRIGKAVNMDYGVDVSTTYTENVEKGSFAEEFGYIVKDYGYRDYPTMKDVKKWKDIVFHELSAGRPVLYGGTSYKNGYNNYFSHSFVIDGYDRNGYVHVNYGFGGNGDGYYPIDQLPLKYGGWDEEFDTYQTLVVIHRPQDGSIDYELE